MWASTTTSRFPGVDLFFAGNHLHGGPAPVRRFLPDRIDRTWDGKTEPGRVFDRTPPPEQPTKAAKRWTITTQSR
jgi:hypothetical protein